jgi:hypothetical protein
MPQPWEMEWQTGAPAPAPAVVEGAKPWEQEWDHPADATSSDASSGSLIDDRTGKGITADSFWPVRMAKGVINAVKSAATAPQDALEGRLDPMSPEGLSRARDFAMTFSPMNPAVRAGDRALAGATRQEPIAGLTPNMEAAKSAAELGAPLPAGVVSENKGVQALTQATRQLPLVGAKIDEKVAKTVGKVGEGVGEIAEELSGGAPPDRATAGASLRPMLQGTIDNNNQRIDDVYSALRHVIDPEKGVPLERTAATLAAIARERTKAGLSPTAGLEDVARLVKEGGSPGPASTQTVIKGPGYHIAEDVAGPPLTGFNGLQRARSGVGNTINFGKPKPGYNVGDLKRVYGAMSADMEQAVRKSALPGVHPNQAASVLKKANETASQIIESNKNLKKVMNIQSDERLVGSVINAAQGKTGNARLLAQLKAQMPKEDFDHVAGVALSELGHNSQTGEFSLNKFGPKWGDLSPTAKSILFSDPVHRQRLDSFANISKTIKGGDQYANKSQTGRAAATGALLGTVGPAAIKAVGGEVGPLMGALASMGAGYVLARGLAKPATAASIARWQQALQNQARGPSQRTQAILTLATRNLISNMQGIPGFSKEEFLQRLQSPVHAGTDNKKLEAQRISDQQPSQGHRAKERQLVNPARNAPISQ